MRSPPISRGLGRRTAAVAHRPSRGWRVRAWVAVVLAAASVACAASRLPYVDGPRRDALSGVVLGVLAHAAIIPIPRPNGSVVLYESGRLQAYVGDALARGLRWIAPHPIAVRAQPSVELVTRLSEGIIRPLAEGPPAGVEGDSPAAHATASAAASLGLSWPELHVLTTLLREKGGDAFVLAKFTTHIHASPFALNNDMQERRSHDPRAFPSILLWSEHAAPGSGGMAQWQGEIEIAMAAFDREGKVVFHSHARGTGPSSDRASPAVHRIEQVLREAADRALELLLRDVGQIRKS